MISAIRFLAFLSALFLTAQLRADDVLTRGTPGDVGMSAKKLQEGVQLYRDAVKQDDLKGAVLLVARNGKIILHESIGWQNEAKKQPLPKDALFRMASNTKAVVATAVMMLAEEGKLSVDDPVGKHLPAFRNEKWKDVRIRHLLTHTSGLRISTLFLQPLMKPSKDHPKAPTLPLEVNRFAAVAPEKKPGTTYSYSNPGYNTLGAIVETVSGQPLETFLTQRIYKPLGMTDTTNHPVKQKFPRMCIVYARDKKTNKWSIRFRQNSGMRVPFVRASGGMVSSAEDYAKFLQMFLNGGDFGGKRLLSKSTVAEMTKPQTSSLYPPDKRKTVPRFYGYGWMVYRDGRFGHSGSEGTFGWVDPKRNIIGLVLTQSPGGKNPRDEFMRIVAAACE